MVKYITLPGKSSGFSGSPNNVKPVILNQIFHATDTNTLYISNGTDLGNITPYGGGTSSSTVHGFLVRTDGGIKVSDPDNSTNIPKSGLGIEILKSGTYSFEIEVLDSLTTEGIDSTTDPTSIIEVYRHNDYSQIETTVETNTYGGDLVASLPASGGTATITIDNSFKWVSVRVREDASGFMQTVQLSFNNSTSLGLWSFSGSTIEAGPRAGGGFD